ncbi:MAG: Ig-like domain repeat protein, partial [Methanobrevibacter sp.]|nr:Ig-like domain repeat protein [Methanobrevibacter sp.]
LPEDIDGIVLINVGGVGYYANVTNGKAKLHLSDVDNGKYDVTAKYLGDDYYAPGENTTSFTVDAKIKPEVEISVDIPENSTNGTITVEVPDDATGNVTVVIDGKVYNVTEIVNGTAVIPIDNLTPGNHTVEVIYSGDDNYSPASNATVVNVPKIKDYPMDVTANDINVGDKTDIVVTLPDDINGVVLIDIDGIGYYVNVTNGIAKVNLPLDLKPGTYDVVATFSGNDKYDSKQVSDSFNVVSKTTEVDIKLDGDKIVVELPEDATGNVTVTIDGKPQTVPVKDGKAVVDISDLEPGNHTIEATYSGDDKYGPGSNSTVVEVPKISDYPVSIDKDGDKLVVSVPDDATGDVTVSVDGKDYTVPIRDGKAVVDISDLAPGNHDVKVTYPGDDKYAPVTNSTTINVPKKSDYPIDIITDGDKLVVSVPEDATGDVTVSIDGKDYTVPIKDGKAVVDISDLPSGTHDVKVIYPGNDKYDQKTVSASIVKERSLVITAPDVVKYFSGSDRFIVYTKDNDGNNISGIEVKITINGKTYTRTSSDGKASLALNLNSGNYTVKVEFAGNGEFKPQTINANVEVLPTIYANDVLKVFRNGTQYYALFVDARGNPLVNTNVSFNINGVFYTRTTNATGWAKLNLNLEKGHYILTAINPVTGEMRTNNVIIFTLIESSDLVKHYRNDSHFVVRVRAADGGWAKAGENVTFNINGVFYTRTTNATGHAKLSINIEPGEYIITSYYKDCRESNTIKVLPRLITSDVVMKYRDGRDGITNLIIGQSGSGKTVLMKN